MNRKIIIALLLIVIIGTSVWLFYSDQGPKVNLNLYQTLGSVTADETAKLLGDKGEVVVVGWDSGSTKVAVDEAKIDSFEHALKKHKGMQFAGRERVVRNPAQMMATGGAMPPDQLLKVVKAHPQAGAIVLFLAFPNLSSQDAAALSQGKTKFIVVSGCNPGYKKLLLDRVITLAIIPQFDRSENTQTPKTTRENFDQNFLVVGYDQAANLPY